MRRDKITSGSRPHRSRPPEAVSQLHHEVPSASISQAERPSCVQAQEQQRDQGLDRKSATKCKNESACRALLASSARRRVRHGWHVRRQQPPPRRLARRRRPRRRCRHTDGPNRALAAPPRRFAGGIRLPRSARHVRDDLRRRPHVSPCGTADTAKSTATVGDLVRLMNITNTRPSRPSRRSTVAAAPAAVPGRRYLAPAPGSTGNTRRRMPAPKAEKVALNPDGSLGPLQTSVHLRHRRHCHLGRLLPLTNVASPARACRRRHVLDPGCEAPVERPMPADLHVLRRPHLPSVIAPRASCRRLWVRRRHANLAREEWSGCRSRRYSSSEADSPA